MVDETIDETQASNSEQGKETVSEPKYVTSQEANSIFTAREKKQQKQLEELRSELANLKSAIVDSREGPKPSAQTQDSEVAQLKKQLAEMQKTFQQEQAKVKHERLQSSVSQALDKIGINPGLKKGAILTLREEGLVDYEGDQVVFKNSFGETIDLENGLKEYFASDSGKHYLQPKNVSGSGDKRPTNPATKPNTDLGEVLKVFKF